MSYVYNDGPDESSVASIVHRNPDRYAILGFCRGYLNPSNRPSTPIGNLLAGFGNIKVGNDASPGHEAIQALPLFWFTLRIKVLTFNIRYGIGKDGDNAWRHRIQLVADTILKHDADIIGIQEAFKFQLDDLLPLLPQYGSAGVGREDGIDQGEHAKVLFRTNLFEYVHENTYWFSDTPNVPNSVTWGHDNTRICTQVRLRERSTAMELEVHNLHIDHESAYARERSTKMLLERFPQELPVIVTGDFNAGPQTPEIRYLSKSGVVFDATPLLENQGTYHGFTGVPELPRIDYIWCTSHFKMQTFGLDIDKIDGRYPSDHFPLWSILECRPTA